jgi:hypothetical protein
VSRGGSLAIQSGPRCARSIANTRRAAHRPPPSIGELRRLRLAWGPAAHRKRRSPSPRTPVRDFDGVITPAPTVRAVRRGKRTGALGGIRAALVCRP